MVLESVAFAREAQRVRRSAAGDPAAPSAASDPDTLHPRRTLIRWRAVPSTTLRASGSTGMKQLTEEDAPQLPLETWAATSRQACGYNRHASTPRTSSLCRAFGEMWQATEPGAHPAGCATVVGGRPRGGVAAAAAAAALHVDRRSRRGAAVCPLVPCQAGNCTTCAMT